MEIWSKTNLEIRVWLNYFCNAHRSLSEGSTESNALFEILSYHISIVLIVLVINVVFAVFNFVVAAATVVFFTAIYHEPVAKLQRPVHHGPLHRQLQVLAFSRTTSPTGSLGYNEIQWDTLGYSGIHWDTLGYNGTHWDTLGRMKGNFVDFTCMVPVGIV